MNNLQRPSTITVMIAMLLVLAIVSGTTLATSRLQLFGRGGNNRPNNGSGQNFQGNNGNFQGNNGNTQDGNLQGRTRSGFNLFSLTRSLGLSPQLIMYVNIAIPIIGIFLLLLSAYGIWKQKIWGLNLATFLGFIFLIGALPTFFSFGGRNINWLRTGLNITSAAATLPILALSFLPSVRDYFPKPARKPKNR